MLQVFLFVCFGGLAFMFFNIQRLQEKMFKTMQEEHARQNTVLRALEARLNALESVSDSEEANISAPHASAARPSESLSMPLEEEPPVLLQGATVAQAAEMLRKSAPLNTMDLRMGKPESSRRTHRKDSSMPDLKF